jgi:hypothetical protein
LNWVRRCAESWSNGRFVLEQETNAYAVLPESHWHGYRPPPEAPTAPWPDTWGALCPALPDALTQAVRETAPVAKAQALAQRHDAAWPDSSAASLRATREFYWSARDAEKHSQDLKHTCNTGSGRSTEGRKTLMNKQEPAEPVLRIGGFAREEAAARQVNAEPWEPMPGMVKRQCPECRYWFAAPANRAALEPRCPDCVEKLSRGRRRPA